MRLIFIPKLFHAGASIVQAGVLPLYVVQTETVRVIVLKTKEFEFGEPDTKIYLTISMYRNKRRSTSRTYVDFWKVIVNLK